MDDPFINVLTAPIPDKYRYRFDELKNRITSDKFKDEYKIDNLFGFNEHGINIYVKNDDFLSPCFGGRTIEYNNPILNTLQSQDFLIQNAILIMHLRT